MKLLVFNMTSIIKTEVYDPDVIKKLIIHEGIDKQSKATLKKYKKMSFNGNQVLIKYNYPNPKFAENNIGRVYAEKSLGLQSFARDIRNSLANKFYIDVDMQSFFFLKNATHKKKIEKNINKSINNDKTLFK